MNNSTDRRGFLVNGGKLTAAAAMLGVMSSANAETLPSSKKVSAIKAQHYYLDDVLTEVGFDYDYGAVVATKTELVTLEVDNGKIIGIYKNKQHPDSTLVAYSADGKLLLPAFKDMHIHLDKTFYGGPWQAPKSRKGKNIKDMIALEEDLLPKMQPFTEERAIAIKDLIQSKGSVIARSHCNIDPVSQLKNLEATQRVLASNADNFSCEIVAFPQHGLLLSNSVQLMREAMDAGAHYVGGLDPTTVDGNLEKSLDTMFQIALDYDKGVDIHLHETAPSGMKAINYMLDVMEQNPSLQNKVTLSHGFALSTLSPEETREVARRMNALGMDVASTIPIGKMHMPLSILKEEGVFVMTGTDSVIDWWSPFGLGDMLEKANLYARLYSYADEFELSRALEIATGNVLPLNHKGEQVWPKVGDDASFVLVDASCSAEAVARISPRTATFYQGELASGKVNRV